jgi:HPt (histidine-containing phosphotransfer) domain-containing protein
MTDYVTKPFIPDRMIRLINSYLTPMAAHTPKRRVEWGPADAEPARPAARAFDLDSALRRCTGDRGLLDRILVRFRERAAADLTRMEAGLASGDAACIERVAHGLKGAAANVSATGLAELAAGLEALGRAGDLQAADHCLAELRGEFQRFLESVPQVLVGAAGE